MADLVIQPQLRASFVRLRWARTLGLPLFLALVVLLVWELSCRAFDVSPMILPAPSEVWASFAHGYSSILAQAISTVSEIVAAFVISLIVGLALAVIMDASPLLRDMLFPNLVLFQLVPKIALAPLFVVWLGVGSPSRLAFTVFIAFFPILISASTGFATVPPPLLRLAQSLEASNWQIFRTLRLPTALPHIFSGTKVAMTLAVIGIIVGEFITSEQGLGYLILFAASKADTALLMACLGVLAAIGMGLYALIVLAEIGMMRRYGPG